MVFQRPWNSRLDSGFTGETLISGTSDGAAGEPHDATDRPSNRPYIRPYLREPSNGSVQARSGREVGQGRDDNEEGAARYQQRLGGPTEGAPGDRRRIRQED